MNKNSLFQELRHSGKYRQRKVQSKKEKAKNRQNLKKTLRKEGYSFTMVA